MKTDFDKKFFRFNQYLIEWNDIDAEAFRDQDCWGIRFKQDDWNYEVLNSIVGQRLLINNLQNYHNKDVPFNLNTAALLPESVTVRLA